MGDAIMKKWFMFLCTIIIICSWQFTISAASNINLKVDTVTSEKGKTVDVPIIISGNTGIAGGILDITYDKELTLTGIKRGTAFSDLDFTPPKHLTSYPVRLLWDGIDADCTNGTIAILTFTAPDKIGAFNITATYRKGDFYDGDMEDLEISITNGQINVSDGDKKNEIIVNKNDDFNVSLVSNKKISGTLIVALYDDTDRLIEVNTYPAMETMKIPLGNAASAEYVRFMWWDSLDNLMPFADSKKLLLN